MQTLNREPFNPRELQAIYNLFAWVAFEQDAPTETVQDITAKRFGVGDVGALDRKDYDEVIRFLVGLRIDDMGH
jgi:hypothetical protein